MEDSERGGRQLWMRRALDVVVSKLWRRRQALEVAVSKLWKW